jgi:hypothetical protein
MANVLSTDPRRRTLAILGGAALMSVVLAFWALHEQAAQVAPKYESHEFFPGLASRIREAARIHIVSKKNGVVDIVFKPIKGWVMPRKSDYPASFEEVNRTLVGLAAMETIEPKTARPDWFHFVALDAPPQGDGVAITVSDDRGRVLANLIAGKGEDIGDATGATGLFVRRPNDDQSWLVRAEFTPHSDPADWIDKNVIDIDRARIQSTIVAQPDGKSYQVKRDKPSDPDFVLAAMPAGRELVSPAAPDNVAAALTNLSFDDVVPSREIDFSSATRLVTETFDGLSITADVVRLGPAYWAEFGATSLNASLDTGKEARTINARVSGWAYKLPDFKGAQFTTSLESLLKPVGTKPAK